DPGPDRRLQRRDEPALGLPDPDRVVPGLAADHRPRHPVPLDDPDPDRYPLRPRPAPRGTPPGPGPGGVAGGARPRGPADAAIGRAQRGGPRWLTRRPVPPVRRTRPAAAARITRSRRPAWWRPCTARGSVPRRPFVPASSPTSPVRCS